MQTQIKTYASYGAYQASKSAPAKPKPKPVLPDLQRDINQIETNYSEVQIRKMYACYLAGKGKSACYRDMPTRHRIQAQQEDLNKIVASLAAVWQVFKSK